MGMDVYGRNPTEPAGEYFRANVWGWRPIHALIRVANDLADGNLFDEETLDLMGHNDGAGLERQNECTTLAYILGKLLTPERLEQIGFVVIDNEINYPIFGDDDLVVDEEGRLLKKSEVEFDDANTVRSAYGTTFDHVKKFIEFLKYCGGFEVN